MKKSRLSEVPRQLDFMQKEGILSMRSKMQVVHALKLEAKQEKPRFGGDLAVDMGVMNERSSLPLSPQDVNNSLKRQSLQKVDACLADIQAILSGATLDVPNWLKPQWGNGGVNIPTHENALENGIAASAVLAQNLMLLSNSNPSIAKDAQPLILNLANLARGIANGDSARVPIKQKGSEWLGNVEAGYASLVRASGAELKDNADLPVDLAEFTKVSFDEIKNALSKSLNQEQQQLSALGR